MPDRLNNQYQVFGLASLDDLIFTIQAHERRGWDLATILRPDTGGEFVAVIRKPKEHPDDHDRPDLA